MAFGKRSDHRAQEVVVEEDEPGRIYRWLPMLVVLGAFGGFVVLAWYAYHSGAQSVKEEDLVVVEADKTPMKEKPLDPGGMKFPNQDKTVFETFANNSQNPPKVERVLPAPEEPVAKNSDADNDTRTWVSEKLHGKAEASAGPVERAPEKETVIAKDDAPQANAAAALPSAVLDKQLEKDKDDKTIRTYVAPVTAGPGAALPEKTQEPAPSEAKPAPEAKPVAIKEAPTDKQPAAEKPAKETKQAAKAGNAKIQLGAYQSEKEALAAWGKIKQKSGDLAGRQPTVVKADLGAKGVFYRLRVVGLAAGDAKAICASLTSKGQACLVPKD